MPAAGLIEKDLEICRILNPTAQVREREREKTTAVFIRLKSLFAARFKLRLN